MRKTKKICTKIPGCPAFTCDDENCLAKKTKQHLIARKETDTFREHRQDRYQTAQWGKLRAKTLSRYPLCLRCLKFDILTPATIADHIIPHRGDWSLFINSDNLQGLCHSCHSYKTNREQLGEFEDYRQHDSK